MKALAKARFVSLLDLMCCGFGGALLIFLIVLSAEPSGPKENPLLIVRCRRKSGLPQAELGIKFRGPSDSHWRWARENLAQDQAESPGGTVQANIALPYVFFSARSAANSGSEACMVLLRPAAGNWEFRPYLVDYPGGSTHEPVHVELEIFGQAVDTVSEIEPGGPLWQPGHDEGPLVRASLRSIGGDAD